MVPKYVGVNRSLIDTGVIGDKNTLSVMTFLLLSTCDEEFEWCGEIIPCGSVVTSYSEINAVCKLTTNQTKYAIKKMKEMKFFSTKFSRNKMVVTVENKELFAIVKEKIPSVFPSVNPEKTPEKKSTTKRSKTEEYTDEFERFWEQYPVKKAKKKAFEKWRSLNPNSDLQETILHDISLRVRNGDWKDAQYVPYATTYLYGRRWEDEQLKESGGRANGYYNPFAEKLKTMEVIDGTSGNDEGAGDCEGIVSDFPQW